MSKKQFIECETEVVVFDTRDVIATSVFEGAEDDFYGTNAKAAGENGTNDNYS